MDIIHIGIASSGRYIMTCSGDTSLVVWSIKGKYHNIPLNAHALITFDEMKMAAIGNNWNVLVVQMKF